MAKQKSMISTVRGYNIRCRLLIAALLLVIAAIVSFAMLPKTTRYLLATKNVFSEASTRLGEDKFYRGETQYMYVWFADNDEGRFYIAPMEDANGHASYMVVYVPNKYIDLADDLVEQTREFENTGDESVATKTLSCRGYTTKPTSQILRFLDQYLTAVEASNDVRENFCDYMFVMVPPTEVLFGSATFYLLLVLGCLIAALIVAISAFTGRYLKKFKNSLTSKNISLDELNADMENASTIGRLFIGGKYIVEAGLSPNVHSMYDMVWIYPQRTNTSGNATTYTVMAYTRYHQSQRYAVRSMGEAEQLCRHILKVQPRALYGYIIENSTMYYSHFNELVDRIYNQPEAVPDTSSIEPVAAPLEVTAPQEIAAPPEVTAPQEAAPSAPSALQETAAPEDHSNDILRPGI